MILREAPYSTNSNAIIHTIIFQDKSPYIPQIENDEKDIHYQSLLNDQKEEKDNELRAAYEEIKKLTKIVEDNNKKLSFEDIQRLQMEEIEAKQKEKALEEAKIQEVQVIKTRGFRFYIYV